MNTVAPLSYHFRPSQGWINDPNGLVWFDGYYHLFYQCAPHFEKPWQEPMHWGHARTKDFLTFEELPVALCPDQPYDRDGCWSGTAIVRDGRLYLFYASIRKDEAGNSVQSVSVAWSDDGSRFEKYAGNPVIAGYPPEGSPDFRDPAVAFWNGTYYCVMATGHKPTHSARLLLYRSPDLLHWELDGVMAQWDNAVYTECPSFLPGAEKSVLTCSVCAEDGHRFSIQAGRFDGHRFTRQQERCVDQGPDQYAGQAFADPQGRQLLIAWIPGWGYENFADRNVGCLSAPRELTEENGEIRAYPVRELRHLLKDSDPAVVRTADGGLTVQRRDRLPLTVAGPIEDLKILRDGDVVELFVDHGRQVYTALL